MLPKNFKIDTVNISPNIFRSLPSAYLFTIFIK